MNTLTQALHQVQVNAQEEIDLLGHQLEEVQEHFLVALQGLTQVLHMTNTPSVYVDLEKIGLMEKYGVRFACLELYDNNGEPSVKIVKNEDDE